ncbi:polyol transporter 2-like protein 1 [Botrytis cinerea]
MFSLKPLTLSKPKGYTIFASLISLGGFLNGYDTGSIGAITSMPSFTSKIGDLSPLLRGFTVSLIMMTGAMPSVFGGKMAEKIGHLYVIMAGSLLFALGTGMEAGAGGLGVLLAGRALAGLGEGLWLGCVSVYITETAPCASRGMLVSLPQFMCTAGVCAGYFTCFGSVRLESSMSWRAPFIIQSLLAVVLAAFCAYLPDSPRWLLHKGRREEALQALERLGIEKEEAEKDILVPVPVAVDYAPTLFETAGLPGKTSTFLASGVSAILMVAITIPATLYVDRWGVVHPLFLEIYASEIQPMKTRNEANSLAQGVSFFANWLVAFLTPIFLAHSSYGAYFLFGGFSLLAVFVMAIWMPETRLRSLEDIQAGFQRLTAKSGNDDENAGGKLNGGMRLRRLLKGPVLVGLERHTEGVVLGSGSDASGLGPMRIELSSV